MTDGPVWEEEPAPESRDRRTEPPAASTLVRFGSPDRGPGLLLAVLALFVAIAVIKPWPASGPPAAPRLAVPPPPTVAPTADPLAGIRVDCQDPTGWRVFSRESWARGILRSWRTLDPLVAASGPLDPAIPDLPIGPGILALGYCAVWSGAAEPPDGATPRAWVLTASGGAAQPIQLVPASTTLHPPLGGLYAPPPGRSVPPRPAATVSPAGSAQPGEPPAGPTWAPGTYVFEMTAPAYQRWWAVTILPDSSTP